MHRSAPVRSIAPLALATALVLALAACSTAGTETSIGTFELDLHVADGGTASATGPVLEAGVAYEIEVQGTYSIWGESMWASGACGGAPEGEPMFLSPDGSNGVVGVDAGFYFAVPNGSALCSETIPLGSSSLDFSLDGGATHDDPDPIGDPVAPTADHTYRFAFVGEGQAVSVKREDSPSSDNYGVLRLEVFRMP